MSRIRANTIVDSAATGAPTFPNGAVINGITTITADVSTTGSNLTIGTGTTISNPSDNEFRILTNGSEKVRVGSGGSVGIGTDDPTRQLEIFDSTQATLSLKSSSTGQSSIWFADTDDTNIGGVYYEHTNDALVMRTNDSEAARFNSSGNLAFPSGQGIDFSATSDGSGTSNVSEILDDYEEGTWTPTIVGGGWTGFTITNATYTKIGNLVFVRCFLSAFTGTGSAAVFVLGGLPFTSSLQGYSPNIADISAGSVKGTYCRTESSSTQIKFYYPSENNSTGRVTFKGNEFDASGSGYCILGLTYNV